MRRCSAWQNVFPNLWDVQRYGLDTVAGPPDKIPPDELKGRDEGHRLIVDLESQNPWMKDRGGTLYADRAERQATKVCADAMTAPLTEGTALTVRRRKDELLEVRVETGRATGKVGFVHAVNVKPEE